MCEIIIPDEFKFEPVKIVESSYDKYQKIKLFQIPEWEEPLIKFSVRHNSKVALTSYKKLDKPVKHLVADNCNVGLKTGAVSGFTVVDADLYKMTSKTDFKITFEDEIKEYFGTFTVRTPQGGYHYFFKYDSDVHQSQEGKNEESECVDIRNDGGYVVFPPSKVNGGTYKIVNNEPIIEMPLKLKRWCKDKLGAKSKKVNKTPKPNKEEENIEEEPMITTTYDVIITNEEFVELLNMLPTLHIKNKKNLKKEKKMKDYRGSYHRWIQVLKGSKFVGMKNEFIEWSKGTIHDNYDENVLQTLWRKEDCCVDNFIYIIKRAKVKNRFTYKRVPPDNFHGYKEINKAKLDTVKIKNGTETRTLFFKEDTNYLTKSDPGTGKTTSFCHFIKSCKSPFISITSRIALGSEQCSALRKEGIKCEFYKDQQYEFGDSIVITPESSITLSNYDFSNYIIFLDEFDSMLTHILTSSTVKNQKLIFQNIVRMILTCKQFICVDADISYISKHFLDFFKLDYQMHINIFKNYKDVKVTIIYDEDEFFNLIRKEDKYILCSDCKEDVNDANRILKMLNDDEIFLITADTKGDDWIMDDHDKIMMSPKNIYGVNSLMKRTVFCHYNNCSISPSQMVQQICRCRNIKEVFIFFTNISYRAPIYDKEEETEDSKKISLSNYNNVINKAIKNNNRTLKLYDDDDSSAVIYNDIPITEDILEELFESLTCMNNYKQDCYNTCKFLHLLNILREKGFAISNNFEPIQKLYKKDIRDMIKNELNDNFDSNDEKVERVNKYLNIPQSDIESYKELFIDKSALSQHFNLSSFFFGNINDNLVNLANRNDYDISKCKDINIKFELLNRMLEKLDLDKLKIDSFVPTYTNLENMDDITTQYDKLFRVRKKNFKLETDHDLYKEICQVYKNLFGITESNLTRFGKNRIQIHKVDNYKLDYHRTIYKFRSEKPKTKTIVPKKNIMKSKQPDKLMTIVKRKAKEPLNSL